MGRLAASLGFQYPCKSCILARVNFLRTTLKFTLENLLPSLVFFIIYHWKGATAAVAFAVGAAALQIVIQRILQSNLSPVFIIAAGFTIVFGSASLLASNPHFYRFEPFAQNFLLGTAFLVTLLAKATFAEWLMGSMPHQIRPNIEALGVSYFRRLTLVWAFYCFLKAALYLYLSYHVNLGELILLRSLLGGGSIALLVLGEILYRKVLRKNDVIC